jgi:hypothetical protein
MTRTERSVYPRAVLRDRSESKSGLDKSLRKGGAGGHNWGKLADERMLEDTAFDDEQHDLQANVDEHDDDSTSSESVDSIGMSPFIPALCPLLLTLLVDCQS